MFDFEHRTFVYPLSLWILFRKLKIVQAIHVTDQRWVCHEKTKSCSIWIPADFAAVLPVGICILVDTSKISSRYLRDTTMRSEQNWRLQQAYKTKTRRRGASELTACESQKWSGFSSVCGIIVVKRKITANLAVIFRLTIILPQTNFCFDHLKDTPFGG